jgi:hypothetical protein
MTYQELDINARINLKSALRAWAGWSVKHFQGDLDKKLYGFLGTRTTKRGIQRSVLSSRYRFGAKRTRALKQNWWQQAQTERVVLQFLQYGRFLDMGVGRGTTHTDRLVSRQLREGAGGRVRVPWYSKRKSYEVKRLREDLARLHVNVPVESLENALSMSLQLKL